MASGVQPGIWVVNGYGIAPAAERATFTAPASTEPAARSATMSSTSCSATNKTRRLPYGSFAGAIVVPPRLRTLTAVLW